MGKLFLQLDALATAGSFTPGQKSHNITKILNNVNKRCRERWPDDLAKHRPHGTIETAIITALTKFAESGRYHNLDTIVTGEPNLATDIPALWYRDVIVPILLEHADGPTFTTDQGTEISYISVNFRHINGQRVQSLEAAFQANQDYEQALRWIRMYLMRTGRWLGIALMDVGRDVLYIQGNSDVPDLSDFFRWTHNSDSHFRSRRKRFEMV